MFREVLAWAFRRADVTPEFTAATCLVHHAAPCTACADACPHEAIKITRTVAIDAIDCTGCGLCVAACPTHALAPKQPAPIARDVRCSQVAGDAPSVVCLARLQPTDVVRMAAGADRVTLGRGACATCDVGDASVPDVVATTVAAAARLLAAHDRTLDVAVVETDRLDPSIDPRALSRRDLLRSGWSQMKQAGGAALGPLERLAPPAPAEKDARPPLPDEFQRRARALALAAPAETTPVPWPLPVVADGCIFCPACTRVCPTDAIRRVFDDAPAAAAPAAGGRPGAQGAMRVELEPERCIGCAACVDVCPVHVVTMVDPVPWRDVRSGTRTLATSRPPETGSVARDAS